MPLRRSQIGKDPDFGWVFRLPQCRDQLDFCSCYSWSLSGSKNGDTKAIGKRFARQGRMLPPGVTYHVSWVDAAGGRCFQMMEADREELLANWVSRWDDLVDFEIVPVLTSTEFWSKQRPE